jgi:enamine deaminase RidA (YjgF/YER057c/UK114 family)
MAPVSIQRVNPPTLPPAPGYSQVVTISGGELVFVAGQVSVDAAGALVGPGDFAAQTAQTFRNLVAALEAAGSGPRNLIKLTTFVTDLGQVASFRSVRDQFLDPAHLPASTLVQVTRLFRPEFLIEIEAIAVR